MNNFALKSSIVGQMARSDATIGDMKAVFHDFPIDDEGMHTGKPFRSESGVIFGKSVNATPASRIDWARCFGKESNRLSMIGRMMIV